MASSSPSTPLLSPPSSTPKLQRNGVSKPSVVPFFSFSTYRHRKPLPSSLRLRVSSPTGNNPTATAEAGTPKKSPAQERIFFDGGAHYGDLVANLLLGFTLLWLPLTLAAVSRAFFLRYRFTDLRVTVISGLTGQDRSDFSYKAIEEVQVVPRFIGEWGDIVITLADGTKVDLRSVPNRRNLWRVFDESAKKEMRNE
ncbi:hypothetical protein H6P81_011189 [Aristolochia fimbriata]|uniref:YdbS-like PH domain-containing protein n=1 Tax=Aristolochia fimbriata TaxID=158543 RepID=A0AAV7ES30_ARIFI|nr:hypothetical protein H6P81_011189 [Aristolochia fimbriata]